MTSVERTRAWRRRQRLGIAIYHVELTNGDLHALIDAGAATGVEVANPDMVSLAVKRLMREAIILRTKRKFCDGVTDKLLLTPVEKHHDD